MDVGFMENLCKNIEVKSENIKLLGKLRVAHIKSKALGEVSKLGDIKLPVVLEETLALTRVC